MMDTHGRMGGRGARTRPGQGTGQARGHRPYTLLTFERAIAQLYLFCAFELAVASCTPLVAKLPSCVSPLPSHAFHVFPLPSSLSRLSSSLFPFYDEKRDVVCLCGGGSELKQVVYHGIDQGAGILMGVFFE